MGDLVQFVRKTAAEERGFSNGHKFREQDPKDIAVDFYSACWDEAKALADTDPKNTGNMARTCVQTKKLAIAFVDAGIQAFRERGNVMAHKTADALEKLRTRTEPRTQPQQRLI